MRDNMLIAEAIEVVVNNLQNLRDARELQELVAAKDNILKKVDLIYDEKVKQLIVDNAKKLDEREIPKKKNHVR